MKILNLYAGIGGNRKQWNSHDITAVEINEDVAEIYKDNFPGDTIIITDAHEYLLNNYKNYDFIWSSPPCQSHSKMVKFTRHNVVKYPDLKLYEEILFLQHFFKGKFVVENVNPYYDFLINPNFKSGRHVFWSNFNIDYYESRIDADITKCNIDVLKKHIGIKYEKNIYIDGSHDEKRPLRNCVLPDLGLYVLNCALKIKEVKENKQSVFDWD